VYFSYFYIQMSQRASFSSVNNMDEEVLFDAVGSARIISLNRVKALNSLNLNMVEKIMSSMQVYNFDFTVLIGFVFAHTFSP